MLLWLSGNAETRAQFPYLLATQFDEFLTGELFLPSRTANQYLARYWFAVRDGKNSSPVRNSSQFCANAVFGEYGEVVTWVPQCLEAAIEQGFENVTVVRVQGHPGVLLLVVHSAFFCGDERAANADEDVEEGARDSVNKIAASAHGMGSGGLAVDAMAIGCLGVERRVERFFSYLGLRT